MAAVRIEMMVDTQQTVAAGHLQAVLARVRAGDAGPMVEVVVVAVELAGVRQVRAALSRWPQKPSTRVLWKQNPNTQNAFRYFVSKTSNRIISLRKIGEK